MDCECQTDEYEPTDEESDFEGINEPPILRQLKNILEQYPDGSQIIRELVQNAEDAGAKEFKIFFSEKTTDTSTGTYGKYFRGPALCVYNDGVFTEEDWIGIKSIYTSVKEKDALKVGRFGLGFKSVFHITDSPVIVSGDRLLVINPLEKPHRVCHTIPFTKLWSTKYKATWSSLTECLRNSDNELFHFSETSVKNKNYPHTLFWFPLRRKASELSSKVYTKEKMEELFQSFEIEASTILLFLKYVSKITIYDAQHLKLEVRMQGKHNKDISGERLHIKDNLTGNEIPQESLFSAYRAILRMTDGNSCVEEEWQIVNYFQGLNEMSENVLKLSNDTTLGYAPYVGVAYPVKIQLPQDFKGHVFCFLPLPAEPDGKSLTNLPVHVNGFFALSPNRRHILWPSHDQHKEDDNRLIWNELIIEGVLPLAYIKLVETLLEDETKTAEDIYRCLPDPESTDSKWKNLLILLYQNVFTLDVFYTEDKNSATGKWISFDKATFFLFEKEKVSKETEDKLLGMMLDYSENIVHLPKHLEKAVLCPVLNRNKRPITVDANLIIRLLHTGSTYKYYDRNTKIVILQYLFKNATSDEYQDLELLPTDDRTYYTSLRKTSEVIYLCHKEKASLFLMVSRCILSDIPEKLEGPLSSLAETGNYAVQKLMEEDVPNLLEKSVAQQMCFDTQPNSEVDMWLKNVWRYLLENDKRIKKVEHLSILPERKVVHSHHITHTHCVKGIYLLVKDNEVELPETVCKTLDAFGITLISALPEYLNNSFHVIKAYVCPPSPQGVYNAIERKLENGSEAGMFNNFHLLSEKVRKHFAVYMSEDSSKFNRSAMVINFLRRLKMFPSTDGVSVNELHSSEEVNGITTAKIKNFPIHFPKLLMDHDFDGIHFAEKLGCNKQDESMLVDSVLSLFLSGQEYSQVEIQCFMHYFLQKDHHTDQQKQVASRVKFIPCEDGTVKAINEIFDYSNPTLRDLFCGERNRFPTDKQWAQKQSHNLRQMDCKTYDDITTQDLESTLCCFENAPITSDEKELKAASVKKCINSLRPILSSSNILRDVPWMPIKKTKPDMYPKEMSWYGANISVEFWKPSDAFQREYEMLVGSVAPIADHTGLDVSVLNSLINTEPTINLVVDQLMILSKTYEGYSKASEFLKMVDCIYTFLSTKRHSQNLAALMSNKDVLWTGSCFTKPSRVYLEFIEGKTPIFLEPYRYQLNSEWAENSEFKDMFLCLGSKHTLEVADVISITEEVKDNYESAIGHKDVERDMIMMLNILNFLDEISKLKLLSDEDKCRIFIPIQTKENSLKLLPSAECTYSDDYRDIAEEEDVEEENSDDDEEFNFIHRKISHHVAASLGVPSLTRRIIESKGVEDMEMEQFGQEEPLTTRIRNLIEEYPDGLSVFKEMLQNADDAGARCMRILYDERDNEDAKVGLIDKGMADCQGPALWFYNDAVFEEKDFQNIRKLGGRTKEKEMTKIGKFGLGFCSVYNVTDVPSILSRNSLVMFDPRKIHLGKALKNRSNPGLRFDVSSPKTLKRLRKQFKPYNGVFGCNLLCDEATIPYEGTLIRLPLRSGKQADESENVISQKPYRKIDVLRCLRKFMEAAGNLLLFTQSISSVELYHVKTDDDLSFCNPFYKIYRDIEISSMNDSEHLHFLREAERCQMLSIFRKCRIHICIDKTEFDVFGSYINSSITDWGISWCIGMNQKQNYRKKEHLPVGSCALPLSFRLKITTNEIDNVPYGFYPSGHIFCFLPLPQLNNLPVHINACFAVENNRKRITTHSSDNVESDAADWNELQMSNTVASSYLNVIANTYIPSFRYFEFWPAFGDDEMLNALINSFYQTIVLSQHKVFVDEECQNGNTQKWAFSECVFLDPKLRYDKELGHHAFLCLRDINELPSWKQVMDISEHILHQFCRAGCRPQIEENIILEDEFYFTSLLASLSLERCSRWNDLLEPRNTLILRALGSNDSRVEDEIRKLACIPTCPNGTLRKPCDLVHPNSVISELFSESDERFPVSMFLSDERITDKLESWGMMKHKLSDDLLIERTESIARGISRTKSTMINRCNKLLSYLDNNQEIHQMVSNRVQNIEFLPILHKPEYWPIKWYGGSKILESPQRLYSPKCTFLVGSVKSILDENINLGDSVRKYLDIKSDCDIDNELVFSHLSEVSQCKVNEIDKDSSECLWEICKAIYEFLNNFLFGEENEYRLSKFKNTPCIITRDFGLVQPMDCSLNLKDNIPPYLFKVDDELKKYEYFLRGVGVHTTFDTEFILHILDSIEMHEYEQIQSINTVVNLYNMLSNTLTKHFEEFHSRLLPDENGCMRKPSDLCFDDESMRLDQDQFKFAHPLLSQQTLKIFGIKSKSIQYIKRYSHAMSFGQSEKLVTRLKGILRDYPCSVSILNELLQNADDAKAREIHFVHDMRTHSSDGLFDNSLKPLQGPALIVFNDSSFTVKDIEGISKLGEGSKGLDPMQTGQFGIGFNSVYHLTDVPSFLTIGEKTPNGSALIMFDPECKYVPLANEHHPGIMIDSIEDIKSKYPGTYNTYLRDKIQAATGTWFRFPLRTADMAKTSEISNTKLDNDEIEEMFRAFQDDMPRALLFLTNVRKIRLSIIEENGQIRQLSEVRAEISDIDRKDLQAFNEKVAETVVKLHLGTESLSEQGFSHAHEVQLQIKSSSEEKNEIWCVSHACGVMTNNKTETYLEEDFKRKHICLSPRAGVAARIDVKLDTESSRAFSFLPLPIKTGLPVHVNGHFSLDSSRTNIWRDNDGISTVKGVWNNFILNDVLPFAYAMVLQFVKSVIFQKEGSKHHNSLQIYNHAFPVFHLIKDNIWTQVASKMYQMIFHLNIEVFPIHLDKTTCSSIFETNHFFSHCITDEDMDGTRISFTSLKKEGHEFPVFFNVHREIQWKKDNEGTIMVQSETDGSVISYTNTSLTEFENDLPAYSNFGKCVSDDKGIHLQRTTKANYRIDMKLAEVLKMLGMKLVECSHDVFISLEESLKSHPYPHKITAMDTITFLKSWNSKYKDKCRIERMGENVSKTLYQNIANVKSVMIFCFRGGQYLSRLKDVPLLIQNNEVLQYFSEDEKKIVSRFCHLFPSSGKHFLHLSLVNVLEPFLTTIYNVASSLTVESFARYLSEDAPPILRNKDPIKWEISESMVPDETWFKMIWKCLASLSDQTETVNYCLQYLSDWCLIPVVSRFTTSKHLYPFSIAHAILDLKSFQTLEWDQDLHFVFSRLDFPAPWISHHPNNCSMEEQILIRRACASADSPHKLLQCIVHHKHNIIFDLMSAKNILHFLWWKLRRNCNITSTLRSAALFQKYDGFLTDLPVNYNVICMTTESVPLDGLNDLCTRLHLIILESTSYLYEVYKALNIPVITDVEFYERYFLPHGHCLDHKIRMIHMAFINENELFKKRNTYSSMEWLIKSFPFVRNEETGCIQRAGDFFTPFLEICRLMCSKKDLLPLVPFHQESWREFMSFAGVKENIPLDVLLQFAKQIEECGEDSDELRTIKSKLLVEHVLKFPDLIQHTDFLREFRKIKCLVPFQVEKLYTDIYQQQTYGFKLIALESSVLPIHWKCAWSHCKILPLYCKVSDKRLIQPLGICDKPDTISIISHISKVCHALQKRRSTNTTIIKELMEDIYKSLEESLDESLNEAEFRIGLCETPFIYNIECNIFLRYDQTVLQLSRNYEIYPYLCRGSEEYGPFFRLFRQLGVTDDAKVHHYARVLDSLQKKTISKPLLPDELEAASKAFVGFINCLKSNNGEDISKLDVFQHIHLPTTTNVLAKSTDILIRDWQGFKERLDGNKMLLFLKSPFGMSKMETENVLKRLPDKFRPRKVSDVITEEISIKDICEPTEFTELLNRLFQMNAFLGGIQALLQETSAITQEQMRKSRQRLSSLRFQCVSHLKTILLHEARRIDGTETEKDFFFEMMGSQTVVYLKLQNVSIRSNISRFKDRIYTVISKCTYGFSWDIKEHVINLIQCEDEEDINRYISEIKDVSISPEDSWSPRLGSYVPLDLLDYLDNTFIALNPGEIVAYEVFDPTIDGVFERQDEMDLESVFVYVRIITKDPESSAFPVYTVNDGTSQKRVISVRLYRFTREEEPETSREIEIYMDGHAHASKMNRDPVFDEIKNTLVEAWKLGETDKKRVVKRILLRWHPDKNPNNQEFAKQVTQFIFEMIRRLNNREFPHYYARQKESYRHHHYGGSGNTFGFDDARQRGNYTHYHYGGSKNTFGFDNKRQRGSYPRHYYGRSGNTFGFDDDWFDRVNRCSKSRKSQRGNRGFCAYRESARVPNPQPRVGARWMKQAGFDMVTAEQQMQQYRALPATSEDDTVKKAKEKCELTMNWICYKCHQAIEKALKSLMYSKDANVGDLMFKTHDLVSLSYTVNVPGLTDLCRRFCTEVSEHHTYMRYPINSEAEVPGGKFSPTMATKAIELAKEILDECKSQ